MLTIDGSFGEGGGQIVRSALALAMVTGRPFAIENIRAGRKKPGLKQQHLTAVRAAAEVSRAEVEGDSVGSRRLVFRPGEVTPGRYHFRIGTAGSTTLVLQTVLPALLTAKGPSHLTLEGGTHNPFAPPFDFLAQCYLPLVERLGPTVAATLERPGFYPAGGGRMTVEVEPVETLGRLELTDRGEIAGRRVRAIVSTPPRHIAERECRTIAEKSGWEASCFAVEEAAASPGPGNVVMIELQARHVTELLTAFGEKGVKAEQVAARVWQHARRYLDAGVPVGEYLADQLLLPLGIGAWQGTGGGVFRTLAPSQHCRTHIEVLRMFLSVAIRAEERGPEDWMVHLGRTGGN
jgi:RNA 3'-terminal phosphate cyclase (ATP)